MGDRPAMPAWPAGQILFFEGPRAPYGSGRVTRSGSPSIYPYPFSIHLTNVLFLFFDTTLSEPTQQISKHIFVVGVAAVFKCIYVLSRHRIEMVFLNKSSIKVLYTAK